MSKTNDEKILELKKVLESKKEEITKLKSGVTSYNTHLVLKLEGKSENLNVLGVDDLEFLLVKLSLYQKEAKSLGVNLNLSSYPIGYWITDIETKLRVHEIRGKEKKIKQYEATLDAKLSEETRNKIDIDNITKELGDL